MLLPFGVDDDGHVVVRGDGEVLDLTLWDGLDVGREIWESGSLDRFMALGPPAWSLTIAQLHDGLERQPERVRRPIDQVRLVLPWTVGDFADFYSSRQHVEAMAAILRPGQAALPEAWLHLPMGYHGRAGTVIVSGEPVYRPEGVIPGEGGPAFQATRRLDVEVELGFVVGGDVPRGSRVDASDAERLIFGMVLVNDWSARDIQAFEYRPLGPFLGKSFATSVSPWVVPWSALEPFRCPGPLQDPPPAAHLKAPEPRNLAVQLTLSVNGEVVSSVTSDGLYWSPAQQLAHLTSNGAGVRIGDLFATGTISGSGPGSLLEAWGNERFLEDGDVVSIEGRCGPEWIGTVQAEVVGR